MVKPFIVLENTGGGAGWQGVGEGDNSLWTCLLLRRPSGIKEKATGGNTCWRAVA